MSLRQKFPLWFFSKISLCFCRRDLIYDLLFIGLLAAALYQRLPYVTMEAWAGDDPLYAWYAKRIFADPSIIFSKQIIEFHPPLFSILLALGNFIFPKGLVAYHCVTLLVNLLGIAFIYFLGIRLSGRFLGLVCAIFLAFNYLYFMSGTLLMPDAPLAVSFLLLVLVLTGEDSFKRRLWAGAVATLTIFLKWPGIMSIPFLIAYYLFLPTEDNILHRLKKLVVPLSIPVLWVLFLGFNNFFKLGTVLPNMSTFTTREFAAGSFLYYLQESINLLVFPLVLPMFFYGLYMVAKEKFRYKEVLLSFFLVTFLILSLTPVRCLRYGLILLPIMIVFSGLGLEGILKKVLAKTQKIWVGEIVCLVLCLVLVVVYYPRMKTMMEVNSTISLGFPESAKWIKERITPETVVLSELPRTMRYFTDIPFREDGGQIIGLPKDKKNFESILSGMSGPIFIEVTIWDDALPSELPLFSEKDEEETYFRSLGFWPAQEFSREVYMKNHQLKLMPVIRIYERKT